jgi:tetratricopeptide (TPR) repeat protein
MTHISFFNLHCGQGRRMKKRMRRSLSFALPVCLIAVSANSQVGTADAEFTAGTIAIENGDSDLALTHLQRAVVLDPTMIKAHFAIGTVADIWCGTNTDRCEIAIEGYKRALELDSSYKDASKHLAYALFMVNRLVESETHYRRALSLHGDDPEALCAVAAMDARRTWRDVVFAKLEQKLTPEGALIDSPSCDEVRDKDLGSIDEGIQLLTKALQIKADSTDVMGFLSWLHAERAEIQCGDQRAYRGEKDAAREWDRRRKEILERKLPDQAYLRCTPPPPLMPGH